MFYAYVPIVLNALIHYVKCYKINLMLMVYLPNNKRLIMLYVVMTNECTGRMMPNNNWLQSIWIIVIRNSDVDKLLSDDEYNM